LPLFFLMEQRVSGLLTDGIESIKGIGAARREQLSKLGITTVEELLCYMPRTYRDLTDLRTVEGMEVSVPWFGVLTIITAPKVQYIRRNFSMIRVKAGDHTGSIYLCWYNQPYMAGNIQEGESYYIYGKPEYYRGEIRINTPMVEKLSEGEGARLLPVYRSTKGLSQGVLRKLLKSTFKKYGDQLRLMAPEDFVQKYQLMPLEQAYYSAHFPADQEERDRSVSTISFYEILLLKAFMTRNKESQRERSIPLRMGEEAERRFLDNLSFVPTGAQSRAMADIRRGIAGEASYQALLQGDVGSGKTVVAFYALYAAALSGVQGALLAPTEILCRQHYENAKAFFSPLGIRVGLLTSGMKKAERDQLLKEVRSGEIQILIGTHAMIQKDVEFSELALAVADEQHRFGVRQRAVLQQKGVSPHFIVMSATPIPRTLALIIYGDLDVIVMDELPGGRRPVRTHLVPPHKEKGLLEFIRKEAAAGNRTYYVCPLIEEGEGESEATSVKEAYERLSHQMPDLRIGYLHGRMRQKEKESAMDDFVQGRLDVLVSTTVIEVGVDVKEATCMVIDGADRFGLAQLHQLRGRVGRGDRQSYCFLLNRGREENQRLVDFCSTNDGFEIARMDLENRGPGALLGQWQHGRSDLFFLNFAIDGRILDRVLSAYEEVFVSRQYGDAFAYRLLARAKEKYQSLLDQVILN